MENITRVELKGKRYYMYKNKHYPNVTSILDKVTDKKFLEVWRFKLGEKTLTEIENNLPEIERKNLIYERGLIENEKILKSSANRGTQIHEAIEENFLNPNNKIPLEKKELESFTQEYVSPYLVENKFQIEKKVIWKNQNLGFGGTFDCYGVFKKSLKKYKELTEVKIDKALIDWKNPISVKYPEAFSKEQGFYYPLTSYFLQTAAYSGAFNQMCGTNNHHKVNKTVVVLNPQKSKTKIYIYFCDAIKTNFYWDKFKDILDCYFNNENFNWENLNKEIYEKKMIPERLIL